MSIWATMDRSLGRDSAHTLVFEASVRSFPGLVEGKDEASGEVIVTSTDGIRLAETGKEEPQSELVIDYSDEFSSTPCSSAGVFFCCE